MTAENDELVPRAVRGGQMRISSAVRDRVLSERASLLVRDDATTDAEGRVESSCCRIANDHRVKS